VSALLAALAFVLFAPLIGGLVAGVDRVVTARMQGRLGPPVLQPFFDIGKLCLKAGRAVNPLAEPLLLGHLAFMALTGALIVAGVDLLFTIFVFVLAAVCLVLAAASADSPYSATGAQRELVLLLAAEPFFVLLVAAICRLTGATTLTGVLESPVRVAVALPGALLTFLLIVALKLRKSPFDVSTSHHAHQELVKGLTSDLSGRLLAYVEVAHWYETVILLGCFVALFFNWSLPLGLLGASAVYGLAILVDNSTARARWPLLLKTVWATTFVLTGGNLVALYLWVTP
jgi:formate hydrogenlyase subunit 4